jgi:ferritin-like metal-binding protein YciE
MDQILSLKLSREKPPLKEFMSLYIKTLRDIQQAKTKVVQLKQSSQESAFDVHDISAVLNAHTDTYSNEINQCSQTFEAILKDILVNQDSLNETTGYSI